MIQWSHRSTEAIVANDEHVAAADACGALGSSLKDPANAGRPRATFRFRSFHRDFVGVRRPISAGRFDLVASHENRVLRSTRSPRTSEICASKAGVIRRNASAYGGSIVGIFQGASDGGGRKPGALDILDFLERTAGRHSGGRGEHRPGPAPGGAGRGGRGHPRDRLVPDLSPRRPRRRDGHGRPRRPLRGADLRHAGGGTP